MTLVEEIMALRGASSWIAIGGLLTLLGGLIALAGGSSAVLGALKSNREQEELILGQKDTFCQLIIYADSAVGWYVSTYHTGPGGAIYDVQVLIGEIHEDGSPVYNRERHVIGTLTSNTWPWPLQPLGIPAILAPNRLVSTKPRYFEAQVTQRNGTSLQEIVIYPKADGTVELGFLRLTFNGIPRQPVFKLLPRGATGITVPPAEIARIAALRGRP